MSDTPHADKFRAALEKVGGWDNSMVAIPAGAVRETIETLAAIEGKLAAARALLTDASYDLMHNRWADDWQWAEKLEHNIDAFLEGSVAPKSKGA